MTDLTHHPDCEYWIDQYPHDCTCGLTAKAKPGMRPWSQVAFDEWAKAVRVTQARIEETLGVKEIPDVE